MGPTWVVEAGLSNTQVRHSPIGDDNGIVKLATAVVTERSAAPIGDDGVTAV